MTRDLRTLLNLELCEECSRTLGWNPAGAASAIGEQQSKRTQSDEQQLTIGEQLIRSGRKRRAAAEADAIGGQADAIAEQQLCTESCPAPDYTDGRRTRGK